MATKIDIISNAFLLLGTPTINSLNDGSSRANVAANLYDTTVDSLLTSNRWNFAYARLALSQLVAAPAHTYTYAYQLPSDYLMPVRVYTLTHDYEIIGDKLYTNLDAVTLDYIARPDESKFPQYFVKALEYRLAVEFCIPITENRAMKETLLQDFRRELGNAMYADSQGRPSREPVDKPFIDCRY